MVGLSRVHGQFLLLLLLNVVNRIPTTGSGCTRPTTRMMLRHIGSTAIRPVTAGGITVNRMTRSSAFATETTASATTSATKTTATRAKRVQVSSRHAVVSVVRLESNAVFSNIAKLIVNSSVDIIFRCMSCSV